MENDNVFPPVATSSPLRKFVRKNFFERTWKKISKDQTSLDFCCGHGLYFEVNPNAFGIEGDLQVANYLKKIGRKVVHGNVLQGTPFQDNQFDNVLSHDVFEHFELTELEILMREIYRVLKVNGILWIWVPNRKGFDFAMDEGHKHFVTPEDVHRMSKKFNFEVLENYPEPLPRFIGKYFPHNKEVFKLVKLG